MSNAAARTTRDGKPSRDELMNRMKTAFKRPDVVVVGADENELDENLEQVAAHQEAAEPQQPAPQTVTVQPQPTVEIANLSPVGEQPTFPPAEPVVAAQPQQIALAEIIEPTHTVQETAPIEATVQAAIEPEQPRSRAGRKPKTNQLLRPITLNLVADHVEQVLMLTAYERIRLRRPVEQSEIVRELMRIGLEQVKNNQILPGA